METYQIIILPFILLILFFKIRKSYYTRKINNYSVSEVKKKLKGNENIILLDVRTLQERNSGTIKPSIHIPLHEISINPDLLKKYQSKEIVCFCQSGRRSLSAAIKLKKLGYNTANMLAGYSAW